MIFILVPRGSQNFRKGRRGECDRDYSNVNCSRRCCPHWPDWIIIVMSTMWRLEGSWMLAGQSGRPHQSSLATDQLLLTDHGNCPSPARLMRGLHANPPIYADILIVLVQTSHWSQWGDGLSLRPTEHCLDDSAHSQLEFMILIDF